MQKEVDFYNHCPSCKYHSIKEFEDPCYYCLNEAANEDSVKPLYFKQDSTKPIPFNNSKLSDTKFKHKANNASDK